MGIASALAAFGLFLTAVGALVSAKGVLITNETADRLSETHWDQNLELKKNLISQSRWAAWGLRVIFLGTFFQMVAVFLA